MKGKLIFIIVMCITLISCYFPNITRGSGQRYKSFDEVLRNRLRKPTGAITKSEYESITRLSYEGYGGGKLTSIDGIQKCTNLESLDLRSNLIKDLRPLAPLKKIKFLGLDCQRFSSAHKAKIRLLESLDPLSELVNLEFLDLSSCVIDDIQALSTLKNLQYLKLSGNIITDLTPLSNLQNLRNLDLRSNTKLKDFTPLGNLKGLQELQISMAYEPGNLSGFEGMASMKMLEIRLSYLGWPRDQNEEDHQLYMEDREAFEKKYPIKVLNIESVTRMPNLVEFVISSDKAAVDLSPLHQFSKLQKLRLGAYKAEDLVYISQIPTLRKLDAGISFDSPDLSSLTQLQHLRDLTLSYNGNTAIRYDSIKQMKNLKMLSTGGQSLTSLEFLRGNAVIEELQIRQNKITDLSPLLDMQNLSTLRIHPVCLSLNSKDVVLPALKEKGVRVIIN